jgi:2-C-methyl-D-erythritol 4-phosphate cytidylyltransferase/2-C-methyl-D-erythritol 2,4-cyclodiphosphate synthase
VTVESVGAILVAAGASTRAGGGVPKQFAVLGLRPMFLHALDALLPFADEIVVVAPSGDLETARRLIRADAVAAGARTTVVEGGKRRQDSVACGLRALPTEVDIVLVHDAARPYADAALVRRVLEAARLHGAAVPCVPIKDTVKRIEEELIAVTLDRTLLALAQTPQGFRRAILEEAYAGLDGLDVTDDAQAVELAGGAVAVVAGDPGNIKVTSTRELETARSLGARSLGLEPVARAGTGSDWHRLVEGRRLVLAGVEIPFPLGLDGWSDADVASHALADAILGAVAERDIGHHFPPGDPAYRDASSLELLAEVVGIARRRGFVISNVDVTIVAEAPRLGPHVPAMREALAGALGVGVGAVSVKATTTEGTGEEGAGRAISAHAIAVVAATDGGERSG